MITPVNLHSTFPISSVSQLIQTDSLLSNLENTDKFNFATPIKGTLNMDDLRQMEEMIQDSKNQENAMIYVSFIKKLSDFINKLLNI